MTTANLMDYMVGAFQAAGFMVCHWGMDTNGKFTLTADFLPETMDQMIRVVIHCHPKPLPPWEVHMERVSDDPRPSDNPTSLWSSDPPEMSVILQKVQNLLVV